MRLNNKNIAYFIGPEFEDLEFWVPLMRLREEGAQVIIAGDKSGEAYRGKIGIPSRSDKSFADLGSAQFDAVVIPGGWAPDKIRRDPNALSFIKAMHQQKKVIAMICHAGLVGISAGIVAGHHATGSEGIKDDLINAGAIWRDAPAFRSGNLVWGRVVADIPDFCRELVKALTQEAQ